MNNTVPESNADSANDREESVTYSDEIIVSLIFFRFIRFVM